jgi:hypothetical protein
MRRVNDLSQFGQSVFHDMGIGLEVEEFNVAWQQRRLMAHKGFPGSIAAIADALDVELTVEKQECIPLVRDVETVVGGLTVPAGRVIGTEQRCVASAADGKRVILEHPQRIGTYDGEERPHDVLEIEGPQPLKAVVPDGIAGGAGTAALMVNAARVVSSMPPGLRTMGATRASQVGVDALEVGGRA